MNAKNVNVSQQDIVAAVENQSGCGTVNFDPSLTGSGKTHGAIKDVLKRREKTIIAVPYIKLANEYKSKIHEISEELVITPSCAFITSEEKSVDKKTFEELECHLEKGNNYYNDYIIVTTHQTLRLALLNDIVGIDGWHLIIDECMDMFYTCSYEVTKASAKMFLDSFTLEHGVNDKLYELSVEASQRATFRNILNGGIGDSFWKKDAHEQFVAHSLSKSFSTYARIEDVKKAVSVLEGKHEKESAKLSTLSVIKKDILTKFSSLTFIAADFDKTVMALVLENLGFELNRVSYAAYPLLQHSNGKRLTIKYAVDRKNSISYKRVKSLKRDDDNEIMDHEDLIVARYLREIGGECFIFNSNVASRDKKVYRECMGGDNQDGQAVLLTAVSGVNEYSTYNYAMYTTAKNSKDCEASIFEAFGVPREVVDMDRNQLSAYQFVSRTSIRERNATDPVVFYVIDKNTAEFLKEKWPESECLKIDVDGLEADDLSDRQKINNDKDYKAYRDKVKKYNEGNRRFYKPSAERFVKMYEALGLAANDEVYLHMREQCIDRK
ncbi:DEAD/DEAH box helicase family protein [Halomonas sp. SL1]|uniref:DEAD/DEAH box helicase family protein n=1 Tax=Halomonas sp. SL1 TaxID=2137478 RepID=UPI0011B949DC|nr:DEAD/DEAH box helicase family protein [Halomonas sp. SL1]